MTLEFATSSEWTAKTLTGESVLSLRYRKRTSYEIDLKDFLILAQYVITNTDLLKPDDPRMTFIRWAKKVTCVPGYNDGNLRLEFKP